MDSQTEEIKRRIDIVDFIGQYVQLKKTGQNWKGLCPFHKEKTPSFMVHRERQIYRCFGCNEAGDIFDFVQKHEGMDFYDALKLLADRAGITLKSRNPKEARLRQETKTELMELNKVLADLYYKLLISHKAAAQARSYIESRKIDNKTIDKFRIGYAPRNIERVRDYLKKMGFSDADLSRAGNPERFCNRLMFPISDIIGNIVGFSGRALEKGQEPKYLNTRETPVFQKAKILYGFDIAKQDIRVKDCAVLVEGQMDVVLSHQAGVINTIATSGTALTEDHLVTIRRQTANIVLAFDADEAGEKTTVKAVEMGWRLGLNIKIVNIPEGFKDAGEVVEKDPSLWQKTIDEAAPAYNWLWQNLSARYDVGSTDGKKQISQVFIPLVAAVAGPVEKDDYIRRLSRNLNISESAVRSSINKSQSSINPRQSASDLYQRPPAPSNEWWELLALLYLAPQKIADAQKALEGKLGASQIGQVYENIFKWYGNSKSVTGPEFLRVLPSDIAKKIIIEAAKFEMQSENGEEIIKDIDQRLQKLSNRWREKIKTDIAQKIAAAQERGDIKKVKKLMEELQEATK